MMHVLRLSTLAALMALVPISLTGCSEADKGTPVTPPAGSTPAASGAHDHDHGHDHAHDHDHGHADDHDHGHAVPEDFPAAVAALKGQYQQIKQALEQGDVATAHDPLHEIGHLLEALPKLAQQGALSEADVAALVEAVNKMFEGYGALDHAIHEGETPDYAAVSGGLDECMQKIENLVPSGT